jgi:hypothetical protein
MLRFLPPLLLALLIGVPLIASCGAPDSPFEGDDDDDLFADDDDSSTDDDDDSSTDDDDSSAADDDDDSGADDDDAGADDDDSGADDDDSALGPCDGSPLLGSWVGTFDGNVNSDLTGPQTVSGDVSFDIECTDRLVISGEMTGAEDSGVPFAAALEGEYDQVNEQLLATLAGTVAGFVDFTGSFTGYVVSDSPYTMDGAWTGTAPAVNGTGSGYWTAELLP